MALKWKLAIISHGDLDGVAGAAVYLLYARSVLKLRDADYVIQFTEPYKLHKVLPQYLKATQRLVIIDLGLNTDTFQNIVNTIARIGRGRIIEWYDHHVWHDDWIATLQAHGVKLYVDRSTCATGVVARYAPRELNTKSNSFEEFAQKLIRAVCAADLWTWDDPLAPKLYRVALRYRGRRGDKWRRHLVNKFLEGLLWWDELNEALNEYLVREFKGVSYSLKNTIVKNINGYKVAFTLKPPGPPAAGIIASILSSRMAVDVVVVVHKRGRGLSLRSTRVNVQEIAKRLGGGGHPRAAGAPLKLNPLLSLASLLYPRIRLNHAVKLVEKALTELKELKRS